MNCTFSPNTIAVYAIFVLMGAKVTYRNGTFVILDGKKEKPFTKTISNHFAKKASVFQRVSSR